MQAIIVLYLAIFIIGFISRISLYACFYLDAYYFAQISIAASAEVLCMLLYLLMSIFLVTVLIYSGLKSNMRLFGVSAILLAALCIGYYSSMTKYIYAPGGMTLFGIRDRILSRHSIQDLELLGTSLGSYLALSINRGDLSEMSDIEIAELQELQLKYTFLATNSKPTVWIDKNTIVRFARTPMLRYKPATMELVK